MKFTQSESGVEPRAFAMLVIWSALIALLAANGTFIRAPGEPPFPVISGFLAPLIIFLAIFGTSRLFRQYVLALNLPLLAAIQAWRFAGFGFLALCAYNVLPRLFAWPAGLGDIAIGSSGKEKPYVSQNRL